MKATFTSQEVHTHSRDRLGFATTTECREVVSGQTLACRCSDMFLRVLRFVNARRHARSSGGGAIVKRLSFCGCGVCAQVSDSEGGDLDVAGDPGPSEPQLDPVSNRLSPEHLTEEELQAAMDSIGDNESLSDEQRAYRFVAEALRMCVEPVQSVGLDGQRP